MPKKPPRLWDRPDAAARGYDARWRQYRRAYLKQNPLCLGCLDVERTTAATVVDHVFAAREHPELFWDESNHQPLCRDCHARKTAAEIRARSYGGSVRWRAASAAERSREELEWTSPLAGSKT